MFDDQRKCSLAVDRYQVLFAKQGSSLKCIRKLSKMLTVPLVNNIWQCTYFRFSFQFSDSKCIPIHRRPPIALYIAVRTLLIKCRHPLKINSLGVFRRLPMIMSWMREAREKFGRSFGKAQLEHSVTRSNTRSNTQSGTQSNTPPSIQSTEALWQSLPSRNLPVRNYPVRNLPSLFRFSPWKRATSSRRRILSRMPVSLALWLATSKLSAEFRFEFWFEFFRASVYQQQVLCVYILLYTQPA